eukprot:5270390-Prymnesium_polylepis.1
MRPRVWSEGCAPAQARGAAWACRTSHLNGFFQWIGARSSFQGDPAIQGDLLRSPAIPATPP